MICSKLVEVCDFTVRRGGGTTMVQDAAAANFPVVFATGARVDLAGISRSPRADHSASDQTTWAGSRRQYVGCSRTYMSTLACSAALSGSLRIDTVCAVPASASR